MPGMSIKSVRFGPDQSDLIGRMAALRGLSVSQYIRDAAYGRAVWDARRVNDVTIAGLMEMIAEVEQRLAAGESLYDEE